MVNSKLLKVKINIFDLAKVFVNIIVKYHSILNSIISNCSLVFILKF